LSSSLESNDRIIGLIDQCSDADFPQMFEVLFEKCEAKITTASLNNTYIRNCLIQGKPQRNKLIFETILLFLKHPLLSEKRMLSLLFMLKQYITQSPKTPTEILTSALSIVRPYYLWPRPYSDVARDVLQMLTIELKSPGATMRKILIEENPDLIKGSPKSGRERFVYILVDDSCQNGKKFREYLRNTNTVDIDIFQLQSNLLANILSSALNLEPESLNLEALTKEDCTKFYESAVQILNEAVLMNQDDAEAYRLKELNSLRTEILALTENSAISTTPKPKHPSLPSLIFQLYTINCDNSTKNAVLQGNLKYPKRHAMEVLSSILEQYVPFADSRNKPVVKIGILGGDAAIHNFVTSYVSLKSSASKLFDGIEIQCFILPGEANDFSAFLSKFDGWYGRHIYFGSLSVIRTYPSMNVVQQVNSGTISSPKVDMDELKSVLNRGVGFSNSLKVKSGIESTSFDMKRMFDEEEKMISPSILYRNEIENYFRESRWRLEVYIYQCECWSESGYFTIPFCQKAELGLKAYTKAFQKQNELADNLSLSAVQQHKTFKFSPPVFSFKYTQMNILGAIKQSIPIDAKPYNSVIISNIPSSVDKGGVPPNPTRPWLEMQTSESDPKKRKTKGRDDDSVSSYHLSQLELEGEDKKKGFNILLDNVLYGPFNKIRITTCNNVNQEEILSIPIMTFFPLEFPF